MLPSTLFLILSFFLNPEQFKSNKQINDITVAVNIALGCPLESLPANGLHGVLQYHGEYTWHEAQHIDTGNPTSQGRGLERMHMTQHEAEHY